MFELLSVGAPKTVVSDFKVVSYSGGFENLSVVNDKGELYFLGRNDSGSMGKGDTVTPTGWFKSTMTDVTDVWQGGSKTTVIRKKDGTVWYCGNIYNRYQMGVDYGVGNVNVTTWQNITSGLPVAASDIKSFTLGFGSSCIQTSANKIFWAGDNASGHFGNGTTTVNTTYKETTTSFTVGSVYICPVPYQFDQQTSMLLTPEGLLYGAGNNNSKLISSASTTSYTTFTAIGTNYYFKKISLGCQNFYGWATTITANGNEYILYSGYPAGFGNTTNNFLNMYMLTNVSNSTSKYLDLETIVGQNYNQAAAVVAVQNISTNAITFNVGGSVSNNNLLESAQAALFPSNRSTNTPLQESNTNPAFKFVRAGLRNMGMLYTDGTAPRLYGVGDNFGQPLGNNARFIPYGWPTSSTVSNNILKIVSAGSSGNEAMGVLMTNGDFYTRGRATNGKLGNGGGTDTYSVYDKWYLIATSVQNVYGGGNTFFIIHNNSVAATIRYRSTGSQAPFGLTTDAVNITPIPAIINSTVSLPDVIDICMSAESLMMLKSNGTVWMAGTNTNGSTGSATTNITTPVQVASGVRSIAMSAATSYYVTTDNKLFCSGDNSFNQLGDGTTTTRKAFAELLVDGQSGIVQDVNAGLTGAHILTTDGRVFGVGAYIYGQGTGRLTTPTLVTLPTSSNGYGLDLQPLGNTASVVTNGNKTQYYGRASLGNYYGLPASSSDAYVPFGTDFDHTKTTNFIQLSNSSWFLNDGKLYHSGQRTITESPTQGTDATYVRVPSPGEFYVAPPGQVLVETVGTTSWTVPEGVRTVSAAVISPGFNTGGGGGLSWRNNIDVTPGETLQLVMYANGQANSGLACGIQRGSDFLVVSYCPNWDTSAGGLGGKNASAINDGGGNGGNGANITLSSQPGYSGGGAGGYTGNGGNAGTSGSAPDTGSGGGGGGGAYYQSPNRYRGSGGGTGIIQKGADGKGGAGGSTNNSGTAGSNGSSTTYGGGIGGKGAIRIFWGGGRYYPDNSPNV